MASGVLDSVSRLLDGAGYDLRSWGLAWARVTPSVTLIPAFGLRAVPGPARVALALALGACIAPALAGRAIEGPWAAQLLVEFLRGLPVAVGAATGLWLATMVGGLADNLRGSQLSSALPVVERGSTPSGTLLAMLVAVLFLHSGGPTRVLRALMESDDVVGAAPRVVAQLLGSLQLVVAIGAPLLVAALVLEVGGALVARAASPSHIQPLLAPLRAIVLLGLLALLLERILEALSRVAV